MSSPALLGQRRAPKFAALLLQQPLATGATEAASGVELLERPGGSSSTAALEALPSFLSTSENMLISRSNPPNALTSGERNRAEEKAGTSSSSLLEI